MRTGRWAASVIAALVLAILPGALRLVAADSGPERALPMSLGMLDVAPATAAPVDVPIIPPDDGLTGELAPVVPTPAPFGAARASHPGEVFALIIGINDYPGTKSDLGAAVADADTIEAALAGFGVPAANRVVLRDGQAQREQLGCCDGGARGRRGLRVDGGVRLRGSRSQARPEHGGHRCR